MIAGEPSGDARAAGVARALRQSEDAIRIRGAGGREMADAGVEVVRNMAREGVVGLWEVLGKLQYFARSYRLLLSEIRRFQPDAVVLVDFPGFNLKLAKQLHRENINVIYYISPQIWAWRRYRVNAIRRAVDLMIVLFPFEEELYQHENVPVKWVGHPLVDEIPSTSVNGSSLREEYSVSEDETTLGVLPGSRAVEFRRHYPRMREAVDHIRDSHPIDRIFVPVADELDRSRIRPLRPDREPGFEHWLDGRAREVIASSRIILTASGTTTLEAALLETPMVICYRVNPMTWAVGRMLIGTDHVGLVNIVAGERIVPECIQWQATAPELAREGKRLLRDDEHETCRRKLANVREKLGPPGASQRAARAILEFLSE